MIKTQILLSKAIESNKRLRVRVRVRVIIFYLILKLQPVTLDVALTVIYLYIYAVNKIVTLSDFACNINQYHLIFPPYSYTSFSMSILISHLKFQELVYFANKEWISYNIYPSLLFMIKKYFCSFWAPKLYSSQGY